MSWRPLDMLSARGLVAVSLAIAAGAGITWGTAWLIAAHVTGPPTRPLSSFPQRAPAWPHPAPLGWPAAPEHVSITPSSGWTYSLWAIGTPLPKGPYPSGGEQRHEQARWDFGIPFPALGYWEARETSVVPQVINHLGSLMSSDKAPMPICTEFALWNVSGFTLPLSPTWPGFALNTLFYAAIAWMLWQLPLVLRRRSRTKLGACVRCGYDLKGLAAGSTCPECGTAA